MELALTQQDANTLISLIKKFCKKYTFELTDGTNICIDLISKNTKRKFKLFIHYENQNYHLNFLDCLTRLNLIRINLNDSFHKNANGDIIRGNRVNLFSEEEFYQRNDGQYMRAYKLPYKNILENPKDFLEAVNEMLRYTNVDTNDGNLELRLNLV